MKTNRDDIINDVGNGLADIRGMAILAIRTAEGLSKASHSRDPEADESLSFALHDILTRIEKLSDGLGGDQIRAAVALRLADAGSDAAVSGASDRPEPAWEQAYSDIGDAIRDAFSMVGIAAELAGRSLVAPRDEGLLFAIVHGQKMVEYLKVRYDKNMDVADAGVSALNAN